MPEPTSARTLRWQTLRSLAPGPRLIVTGVVHGIETCGKHAIERVLDEFADGRLGLLRGQVTFVPVCNPLALAQRMREGEGDLNRSMRLREAPHSNEEHIANALCPLLLEHDALLDLHSFQSAGQPFAVIGPDTPFERASDEAEFARHIGVSRFVEGSLIDALRPLLPERGASTANFMRAHGKVGLTVECGQHLDASAPEVAYRAIHRALAWFGLIDAPTPTPVAAPISVRYRVTISRRSGADHFVKAWQSFDPIRAGELVGIFGDGEELRADRDGYILFPDPLAGVGTEWVYFTETGNRLAG
jgi:predicted deacylase